MRKQLWTALLFICNTILLVSSFVVPYLPSSSCSFHTTSSPCPQYTYTRRTFSCCAVPNDYKYDNVGVPQEPSILMPPSSSSRGIIVVDPFFHGEYMIDKAHHDYAVGVVRVLSPYMARGFHEQQQQQQQEDNDDSPTTGDMIVDKNNDDDAPFNHWSLTAPLSKEHLDKWLESIPFSIVAVICESDSGLEYAERLACAIGKNKKRGSRLRHNGWKEARRDKYWMNEVCRQAGIDTARQVLCTSAQDAVEKAAALFGCTMMDRNNNDSTDNHDTMKNSIIIKPRRGVASDRVSLCSSPSSVRSAINEILSTTVFGTYEESHGAVLMQEYVNGIEFAVDTVSKDGMHKVAAIWVYERVSTAEDESNPFAYLSSKLVSSNDPRYPSEQVIHYVEACLDALHIQFGIAHTEVKVTPEGLVRLMEVNVRQHNDNIWPMCSVCLGYNALDMCLSAYLENVDNGSSNNELSLFESVPSRPKLQYAGMVVSLVCYSTGMVRQIRHVDEIRQMESFVDIKIYPGYEVGNRAERSKDIRTDAGWIHFIHADEEVLARDYDRVRTLMQTMFQVEDEMANILCWK